MPAAFITDIIMMSFHISLDYAIYRHAEVVILMTTEVQMLLSAMCSLA